MKSKYLIPTIFAVISVFTVSCGKKSDKNKNSDEFLEAQSQLSKEIKDLAYRVPPPSEIPYLLQATGADFNHSLINDKNKADSYISESDRLAINLGVYTADIGYLSSYEKAQELIDYLNVCKKMADKIGVSNSFDKDLLDKFEANISNKDTLASLLNAAVKKTDQFLKEGSRSQLGALVVTGGFVESLYIATGIVKTYPKNMIPDDARNAILTPLMQVIINQKQSVSQVVQMLSDVDQEGLVPDFLASIKDLEASYQKLDISQKIKDNKGSLALSDKTLVDITEKIEKLRSKIVL